MYWCKWSENPKKKQKSQGQKVQRYLFTWNNPALSGDEFADFLKDIDAVTGFVFQLEEGELMSKYPQSLDAWHYGDDYGSLPVLSNEWTKEPREFIDRTLAVQSNLHHQFTADFRVEQIVTAPIPLNRTPGLIDHF